MADDGENMFGRDSDSSSEEAEDVDEAAVNTEEITAPTGGGAAGGFLGQVEKSVAKPEGSSGSGGGSGGGEGTAPSTEGKAREGEEEDRAEDSPPPQTQGGAQPKKTLPRPACRPFHAGYDEGCTNPDKCYECTCGQDCGHCYGARTARCANCRLREEEEEMSKREAKAEAVAAYKAAKARGASDEDAIMAAALASRWSASEIAREIARERVRERTREIMKEWDRAHE